MVHVWFASVFAPSSTAVKLLGKSVLHYHWKVLTFSLSLKSLPKLESSYKQLFVFVHCTPDWFFCCSLKAPWFSQNCLCHLLYSGGNWADGRYKLHCTHSTVHCPLCTKDQQRIMVDLIVPNCCYPNCCRTNWGNFFNSVNFLSIQKNSISVLVYLCTFEIVYMCTCVLVY